jgi:23S rRNA (adenine2503-C2)-methyltransferase
MNKKFVFLHPMPDSQKIDIRSLSPEKLKEHFISIAEPGFRAKQVYEWL